MIDMNALWQPLLLVILAASLSFAAATYIASRKREDDVATKSDIAKELALNIATATTTAMQREIAELKRQIDVLNIPVQQLNTAFQAILVRQLTHFHTKELDDLMEKLGPPLTLTAAELKRMEVLLKARENDVDDQIDESEREAAHMLPMVIKRVAADLAKPEPASDLIVVAVPRATEEMPEK